MNRLPFTVFVRISISDINLAVDYYHQGRELRRRDSHCLADAE